MLVMTMTATAWWQVGCRRNDRCRHTERGKRVSQRQEQCERRYQP